MTDILLYIKNMNRYELILFILLVFTIIISKKGHIFYLYSNSKKYTPDKFFSYRKSSMKNKKNNVPGIYVFHNHTKRLYYVGQSDKLLTRVNNHFNGRGNGDVYADYKYGDRISVKMIPIKGSGYFSLNKMEKDFIKYFKANTKGYNKTKGNK